MWWGWFYFICGPRLDDTLKEFWFLKGRGQPELNRWPLDLQSNALPLSYTPSADERRLNFNTNLAQFNPNMLPVRLGNNEIRAWNFISTHAIMIEGILHKQWQFKSSMRKWDLSHKMTPNIHYYSIINSKSHRNLQLLHITQLKLKLSIKFDAFWAVADFVLILLKTFCYSRRR